MKNYLLITIAILSALVAGFLLGRYTSDSGRYYFKYSGNNSSLFDTKTGDLYQIDEKGVYKTNYKYSFDNPQKK
ncbi:hypothetical protein SAMN05421594_1433 [Chryseobacterium oleae]|uniref:Uncharacterized protein n=1 Tax=Chryseobacterium oleae TaxID=491207 RepID=A0A1I4WRJ0_CHROL|nr:hypothetical protein [Chryseobacterium oleae]SFN15740.1 hypothetical protein SAMN05421594_1433 [Chryseobacterium oleae]